MKLPDDCKDINEIRTEIDSIDKEIIAAIGMRYQYVRAASKFKKTEEGVKAPDRVKAMLLSRRAWAQEAGLNPDIIEKIYSDLVSYFVNEEMQHWKQQ